MIVKPSEAVPNAVPVGHTASTTAMKPGNHSCHWKNGDATFTMARSTQPSTTQFCTNCRPARHQRSAYAVPPE